MANLAQTFVQYLKDSKAELQKVAWPSKKDIVRYSVLVVASVIIVAATFGAFDLGLSTGLQKLIDALA